MKKILVFLLRVILTLIVPAIFVGLIIFALQQSFAVGLVILLGSIVVQVILANKFEDEFSFGEFKSLSFEEHTEDECRSKRLNILFNLTKIASVLAFLQLIRVNYPSTNPFGDLGLVILISVISILLLITIFKKRGSSYSTLRTCLVLIVVGLISTFFYLYFGTQLLWALLALFVVSAFLFDGFEELEDKFGLSDISFIVSSSIIFVLTAIVSTIIQYWRGISGFFIKFWEVISNFFIKFNVEFWGLSVWFWLLGLIVLMAIWFFIVKLIKRQRSRKEAKAKMIKEEEEKQKRLKAKKEEEEKQKKAEEEAEKKRIEKLQNILNSLEKGIAPEDLIYLAKNRLSIKLDSYPESLIKVNWEEFFQISELKRQIVWQPELEDVLFFFGSLYGKSYKDEELKLILGSLKNLYEIIAPYPEFTGMNKLNNLFEKTTPEIPRTWFRPVESV
jgi:hypothetical protein